MERQRCMITIADILQPKQILLDLKSPTREEAILEIAQILRSDPRISDWSGFYDALKALPPCLADNEHFDLCIPHARTHAVSTMVMGVGRYSEIPPTEDQSKTHYIFVIGVPVALAADYLRIIGALARIFRHAATEKSLRGTKTGEQFIAILERAEMKL